MVDTLQRYVDTGLSKTISDTLVESPLHAIEELICNSYDADATTLKIKYDSDTKYFLITDDGSGMDSDGIKSFYRMGDSPKLDDRVTPKGRRTIGQFGIASVLLRYLTEDYNLISRKNGEERSVYEKFSEEVDDTIPLDVIVKSTDLENGTLIEMKNFRYDLDISGLKRRIRIRLPLSEDFRVYFNDEEIKPTGLASGEMYMDSRILDDIGVVSFKLVYHDRLRVNKDRGVYVYVNGRQVGHENDFHFGVRKEPFFNRVMLRVDADGLEDFIAFDRSRFQATPEVERLREEIVSYLNYMKTQIQGERKYNKRGVSYQSERAGRRSVLEKFKSKRFAGKPRKIKYLDLEESGPIGLLQDDSLVINTEHPLMPSSIGSDFRDLEAWVDYVFTVAATSDQALISDYSQLLAANTINNNSSTVNFENVINFLMSQQESNINPNRLYTFTQGKKLLGVGRVTFDTFTDGFDLQRERQRYLGSDIIQIKQDMEGYTPLWEFITNLYSNVTRERQRQIREKSLKKLEDDIPPFIKDIGDLAPVYMVKDTARDQFINEYTSRMRKTPISAVEIVVSDLEGLIEKLPESDRGALDRAVSDQLLENEGADERVLRLTLIKKISLLDSEYLKRLFVIVRDKVES